MGLQYIVRRISIRDAEILSVGKIAEFAKFAGGGRLKSPDAVLVEVLPGILCVRGVQREFEDLLKVAD